MNVMVSGAALPAFAIPEPAANTIDPIFAAIAAHRDASLDLGRKIEVSSTMVRGAAGIEEAEAVTSAAWDVSRQAALDLMNIQPTTPQGLLALLDHIDAYNRGELTRSLGDETDGQEHNHWPGQVDHKVIDDWGRPLELPFAFWMLRHVRSSIAGMVGLKPCSSPAVSVNESDDPVFAAIEAHRQAYKRRSEALEAEAEAQKKFHNTYGYSRPNAWNKTYRELIAMNIDEKWRDVALLTHEDIDSTKLPYDPEHRAAMHEELDRQRQAYKPVVEAERQLGAAHRADVAGLWAIAETRPTTPKGAVAMLRYCTQISDEMGDDDWPFDLQTGDGRRKWIRVLHETLADALIRRM